MTKRSTVDFSMDDDLGLGRPPDRRLISSDNLYPGPPGVGPQDSEFSIAAGKTSPSNNWVTVGNSASRDPRLARSAAMPKSPPPEKQKQLFDKLGIPISPERNKKMETRKSEDRRRSPERDRSRERSRSRSPKRSRDRYREERYDREREDRYRRKRRSPSPPPAPQHQTQREQQFQQPQQFAPNPQQYMAQPPPPMYNDANYQTYPPPYGQQVQVQNIPPQQFGGYEGFMQNPPPYVPSYQPAPPTMITQPPVAPPPQPDVAQQQWHPPTQDPVQAAEQIKREAAVASEMRQQKATLRKQRQDYLRKQGVLKRELQVLKDQRSELKGSSRVPPSPDSQRFLKENAKLQLEIGNKLKTINNVIDMLSGIIGEDRGTPDTTRRSIELAARSPDSSPERLTRQIMDNLRDAFPGKKSSTEAPESSKESSRHSGKQQYNYIHYDPEMHWCQICDVFPKTAKEYLNHLHSDKHEETVDLKKIQEAPWHLQESSDEELPIYPGASSKRLPIRGLQHFIPAAAWFCKLCNRWMGDLHCASLHLKSKTHAKAYSNFVEQNPHWETDWMADRQKSYERIRNNENVQTPSTTAMKTVPPTPDVTSEKKKKSKKEKKQKKKNKKRKKSSSSETSGSTSETEDSDKLTDKANSIRVAMRNKLKAQAAEILLATENAAGGKWMEVSDKPAKVEEKRPDTDEKLISNWMSNRGVSDSDKKMFESLRNRMKLRQESIDSSKDKGIIKSEEKESYENKREDQSRDRERERERERDRDKDYHRDKDRDYDRGYYRRPYDRRDRYDKNYRSPDRKRYRNSRSPNKPRVEVGVITNPPPAPKPPKFDKKIKSDDQADGSTKSKPKVLVSTTLSSSKKLPFIGRMPVFKLKKNDGSPKESSDDSKPSSLDTAKQRRDAINAQIQKAMEDAGLKVPTAPPPPSMDNSMADPSMAYTMSTPVTMVQEAAVYAMAPPPPPILHYEQPPVPNFIMAPPAPPPPIQDDLPPGLESSDLETVKVPPKSNKKPLPKDFEDALDIIFPDPEKKPEKPPTPVQMMPPEMQQQMMYGMDMSGQYVYHPEMYAAMQQQAEFESMGFIPQPEVELMPEVQHEEHLIPEPPPPPEEPEVVEDAKTDMDDLAMLGIDESDITAQGF